MRVKSGLKSGQGLGDAIANLTNITGIDNLTRSYETVTGKSCGCKKRQEALNNLRIPSIGMLLNT